jgi:hypothetical protein
MRGLAWFVALLGIAQYGIIAYLQPDGYVSVDMAYLVMALFILAAAGLWACSWCSCWGWGGCGCDHCEGCREGDCCGDCACYGREGKRGPEGAMHSHDEGHGHSGHSH